MTHDFAVSLEGHTGELVRRLIGRSRRNPEVWLECVCGANQCKISFAGAVGIVDFLRCRRRQRKAITLRFAARDFKTAERPTPKTRAGYKDMSSHR